MLRAGSPASDGRAIALRSRGERFIDFTVVKENPALRKCSSAYGMARLSALALFSLLLIGRTAAAQSPTPGDAGRRIADYIATIAPSTTYRSTLSDFGTLLFANATHDTMRRNRVIARYDPFLSGLQTLPLSGDVDSNSFGILPFELYLQTGQSSYLPAAQRFADTEFASTLPDGSSSYSRYWADDMFMVGGLQIQAYRALKNPVYIDRAATQLTDYIARDQQPGGLFFHQPDQAQFYWGRGNGWAAVAMCRCLLYMPSDHSLRPAILSAFRKQMDALVNLQAGGGYDMWYQLLDNPALSGNWEEPSCTAMFVYALATGVQQGWLTDAAGDRYRKAATLGWNALVTRHLDAQGRILGVCIGTVLGSTADYYLTRPRADGDLHGELSAMWAATAMLTLPPAASTTASAR